jgi:hypothetical protein
MQIPKIEPKCEYCNHFNIISSKLSCEHCIHNPSYRSNFDPNPNLVEKAKMDWYMNQLEPRFRERISLKEYNLHDLEVIYKVTVDWK